MTMFWFSKHNSWFNFSHPKLSTSAPLDPTISVWQDEAHFYFYGYVLQRPLREVRDQAGKKIKLFAENASLRLPNTCKCTISWYMIILTTVLQVGDLKYKLQFLILRIHVRLNDSMYDWMISCTIEWLT